MKVLNLKKVTPLRGDIVTTADRYTEDECIFNGILNTTKVNTVKDIQKIISAGPDAIRHGVSVGSSVIVNFNRFQSNSSKSRENSLSNDVKGEEFFKKKVYNLPTILVDSAECLFINIQDIELVVDDFEYVDEGVDIDYDKLLLK